MEGLGLELNEINPWKTKDLKDTTDKFYWKK